MRWLEHRIHPPLVALIVAALMWAAARLTPAPAAPFGLRLGLALALAGAGAGVAGAGVFAFRRAGASIDPHHIDKGKVLVTSGVYRFTRNPMYLGVTLALCGYAVYLFRPVEALGPIAFLAYIRRFQVLPEERAMVAKFGAAYEAYTRATRRWI
jgi:protein-S-isoprenylcysteine O-methyltransferase Ste14